MGIDDVRPSQVNNHLFAISPEGSYMWHQIIGLDSYILISIIFCFMIT